MNTCIFIRNYHLKKISSVVPTGNLGCHLYSGVPRANSSSNISLQILLSKCHQTLKQIAIRLPLGAANLICLLQGAASLENTD